MEKIKSNQMEKAIRFKSKVYNKIIQKKSVCTIDKYEVFKLSLISTWNVTVYE